MAEDESVWDGNGPGGLTVVIPLPTDVIESLMNAKYEIEVKKNVFFKRAQSSGYISIMASEFLLIAIDEFVPTYRVHNRQVLLKFLQLSNIVRIDDIGIYENQVLVNVAGIRIVVLNLDEAVFRADLFTSQQHWALREISARKVATTTPSGSPSTVSTTGTVGNSDLVKSTKASAPTDSAICKPARAKSPIPKKDTSTTSMTPKGKKTPSKKSASPSKSSKKHCMNGAECRNILNGTCRFHHTAQEIAQAGAIIEECIGISLPKVGWIIGTNGDNITAMRKACGADIWIEDEIVYSSDKQKIRMLHVLGSREAVVKGIELVMESAADCNDEYTELNNVEALIGVSPAKQKELLGSSTLKMLKDASGADILAGENDYSLRVVGTNKVVEKAIELVMQWAAHSNGKTREKSVVMPGLERNSNATPPVGTTVEAVKPSSASVAENLPVKRSNDEEGWPALGLPNQQKATASPRVSTKPFLQIASEYGVDARNAYEPPADINDNTSWPALSSTESFTSSTPPCVPDRPAIQPTKKTSKNASAEKIAEKKKKNADICIHGAACRFIRNGVDDCEFYHSPKELEQATAAAAKKNGKASSKTGSKKAEYVMRISRSQAAWVIGKKGNHVKEIIQKSGVEFSNDPSPDGAKDDRIVRIVGTQEAVDIAVEMVLKRLPDRDKAKLGSNEQDTVNSDSTVRSNAEPANNAPRAGPTPPDTVPALESQETLSSNTIPEPAAAVPPPSPASHLVSPPMDAQSANLISPPQPIRQFQPLQHETSFASSAISVLSEDSKNASHISLGAYSHGHGGPITGQTLPMLAPSISSSRAMTPLSLQDQSFSNSFSNSPPTPQKQMIGQMATTETSAFVASNCSQRAVPCHASTVSTPTDMLLAFLNSQQKCLKGSPEGFLCWLATEDITSLDDLAEAVSDDEYLRDILQQADGSNGVKGYKRAAFKKAVIDASQAAATHAGSNMNAPNDDEEVEPFSELICPISQVLMMDDPVIAADGHTYERSAIEAWFQKQTSEVAEAQQQMATVGSDSQRAREIIQRGVLSPMTHTRMEHLTLTPNHAVRTMAKDSVTSSN